MAIATDGTKPKQHTVIYRAEFSTEDNLGWALDLASFEAYVKSLIHDFEEVGYLESLASELYDFLREIAKRGRYVSVHIEVDGKRIDASCGENTGRIKTVFVSDDYDEERSEDRARKEA